MSEKNNENTLKILIGILGICLLGLLIYTVNFYWDNKDNIAVLEQERQHLQEELSNLKENYNSIIVKNTELKNNLEAEQKRVSVLLDSLEKMNSDFALLQRYRVQADMLKMEKQRLFTVIDSISDSNEKLRSEIDSTATVLEEAKRYSDSLNTENKELSEKVEKASVLQVSTVVGEAVVIKGNGEVSTTNRANRAQQIRTCLTITKNPVVEAGDRKLFVQIINPENNLLGDKEKEMYGDKVLIYSSSSTINYQNQKLDVCILTNTEEESLVSGRYIMNIFDGPELISSSVFELK